MIQEVWADVLDYEGVYKISNFGKVKRVVRASGACIGRVLFSKKTKCGYLELHLCFNGERRYYLVHRLVAEAFIPNPEDKKEVNHKNGIKTDNRVENLEWVTSKENKEHANIVLGINNCGEKSGQSKLTEEQICNILGLLRAGQSHRKIAKTYSVVHSTIGRIYRNETWKCVSI